MHNWKKCLKGAMKSKLVQFGAFVAAIAPYTEQLVGYASGISPEAGASIGICIIVLRAMTTQPLNEK